MKEDHSLQHTHHMAAMYTIEIIRYMAGNSMVVWYSRASYLCT